MPGIVGVITGSASAKWIEELNTMVATIRHESFYRTGTYVNEGAGVYTGWAAAEGSFSDCMPATNETRDIVVVFSGQDFGHSGRIDDLKRRGHDISLPNASYLPHLYEEHGPTWLRQLNGWFSGLIIDIAQQQVVLFNDRFGVGRIYVYATEDSFYFASEAKALLSVRPELREIDRRGLAELFSCGCPLENRTLFKKISLLPGGSAWIFTAGRLRSRATYFSSEEWASQSPLDERSFLENFDEHFQGIMPNYVASEQRAGMSLTGGLDGRMMMACMNPEPGSLPCYTFSGERGEIADARIGRQVAAVCGQPHVVLPISRTFLTNFATYAERTVYISDGLHGVGGAHDLYLNELARNIAPVRMSGKFGSEIVRGVRHLKARPPSAQLFDRDFYGDIQAVEQTVARLNQSNPVSVAAFAELPWWHYGCLTVEQSQVTFLTPFVDNRLVELMYRGVSLFATPHRIPWYVIARHQPALLAIETDRGLRPGPLTPWRRWRALRGYLSFKADWVFTEKPPAYARAASLLEACGVDRILNGRHILTQYRRWFQRECRDYVLDVLLDPRTRQRAFWKPHSLQRVVSDHFAGSGSYVRELEKALTVELIHRHLLETA